MAVLAPEDDAAEGWPARHQRGLEAARVRGAPGRKMADDASGERGRARGVHDGQDGEGRQGDEQ